MIDRDFLIGYAVDSLDILKVSMELSRGEHPEFYRVAAAQLRLLLCDTTRQHGQIADISLLGRVYPDMHLPFSIGDLSCLQELPLTEWRQQPLPLSPVLTIRQLVRQVCDLDGGAHVDPKKFSQMQADNARREWILKIAEMIIPTVEGLLLGRQDPHPVSPTGR
jgi:hypothetical protein